MLKVTVLELPAAWNQPKLMLRMVEDATACGHSDLLLLPEASLSGYVSPKGEFDLSGFAEPLDGPTSAACAQLARVAQIHLVAPLVLREGAQLFNAISCFAPGGQRLFTYKKRHPWMPETWATPGPDPIPRVDIKGYAVTAAICFDLHFLEAESKEQLDQADLLLFPSAWVDDGPEQSLQPLLQDLARRFELYVANANWGPGTPRILGQGGSCIIDPTGKNLGTTAELP